MAKTQHKPKQPRDPYAQQAKALASAVLRLRGWIGTDASRAPELVDALNALVAHRLRGHAHVAAGTDAQEAVKRSADLLLAEGPIGPYTAVDNAGRCGSALIQLAAVQAGLGLAEPAGQTIASWDDLRAQLGAAGIDPPLEPVTVVRAVSCSARAALAAGDVGLANAYTDASLVWRARVTPSEDGGVDYVGLDVDRLASDCRWAAGLGQESLAFAQAARSTYDAVVGDRLAEPGRYPPALVERLAEPLFGLYRDLADRLAAVGERDLAIAVRRTLVERLQGLVARSGEPARRQLASALTDLADDLLAQQRAQEALGEADEAVRLAEGPPVAGPVRLLARVVRARAAAQLGDADAAGALRQLLGKDPETAGSAAAAVAQEVLRQLEHGTREDGRFRSPEGQASLDRARGVVLRGRERVSWEALDATRAYGLVEVRAASPAVADPQQAGQQWQTERDQAHRREEERREQARQRHERQATEAAAAAQAEVEREEAEQLVEQERQRREAEHQAAAERVEQQERKRRREARLREHEVEVARRGREQRAARREEIGSRLEALSVEVSTVDREQERDRLSAELTELNRADTAADRPAEPIDPVPADEPAVAVPADPESTAAAEVEVESEPATPEAEEDRPGSDDTPRSSSESVNRNNQREPIDELVQAEQAWASTRVTGTRREARAAAERFVELLRPRAASEPESNVPRLRAVLEELASLRLRSGDIFGSRSAAREARSLR